jgi:hypothetical protein
MAERHFKYVILGGGVAAVSSYYYRLLFASFRIIFFCFPGELNRVDTPTREKGN